jgi:two-component system, sensor histidine kinase and response regulator
MPVDLKSTQGSVSPLGWTLPETLQMLALGGDAEVVADIIALFRSDSAKRLGVIRDGLRDRDASGIIAQAHALKGSAIQVGADSLAAVCRQIEIEARTLPFDALSDLVRLADSEFERLWTQS